MLADLLDWFLGRVNPFLVHPFHSQGLVVKFAMLDLRLLFVIDRREEVLDDVVLPVAQHAVTLDLLVFEVNVFYVHACVVREVPESHFLEFLSEQVFSLGLQHVIGRLVKYFVHGLLPSDG